MKFHLNFMIMLYRDIDSKLLSTSIAKTNRRNEGCDVYGILP